MLKRHSAFLLFFKVIIDIAIILGIWVFVYFIRFKSGILAYPKGITPFGYHLKLSIPIVALCYFAFVITGIYKPKRIGDFFVQFLDLAKAVILSGLLIMTFFYYVSQVPYSRTLLSIFVVMLFIGLSLFNLLTMRLLRFIREKGYNQRHFIVIGAKNKARQLVTDIKNTGWLGLKCAFFVSDDTKIIGKDLLGIPVYGPTKEALNLIKNRDIDEVYMALDKSNSNLYPILEALQLQGITVRIVPDWGNLISISKPTIVPIGSQVLFSAGDSPLTGINIIIKEFFDRTVAFLSLVILFIPMSVIALFIKSTSKGTVFYKQTRMGMNQKTFDILKFRTMHFDAEQKSGPQWTNKNDGRCTAIGRILRKTSLDELPQLINVLKGEMSLVGPRPERPYFVDQFSENHRRYMLRHKVKAGMTGWAQVNGLRGDTSLRKRLIYDLYYIKNWSLWLDLWILILTPWNVIKGKNSY